MTQDEALRHLSDNEDWERNPNEIVIGEECSRISVAHGTRSMFGTASMLIGYLREFTWRILLADGKRCPHAISMCTLSAARTNCAHASNQGSVLNSVYIANWSDIFPVHTQAAGVARNTTIYNISPSLIWAGYYIFIPAINDSWLTPFRTQTQPEAGGAHTCIYGVSLQVQRSIVAGHKSWL